jgi:hypothetical protein
MLGQTGRTKTETQLYRLPNPYTNSGFLVASTPVLPAETCPLGLADWNAIVAAGFSKQAARTEKALKLSDQGCVEGFEATLFGDFNKLCWFTCKYNYVSPGRHLPVRCCFRE